MTVYNEKEHVKTPVFLSDSLQQGHYNYFVEQWLLFKSTIECPGKFFMFPKYPALCCSFPQHSATERDARHCGMHTHIALLFLSVEELTQWPGYVDREWQCKHDLSTFFGLLMNVDSTFVTKSCRHNPCYCLSPPQSPGEMKTLFWFPLSWHAREGNGMGQKGQLIIQ